MDPTASAEFSKFFPMPLRGRAGTLFSNFPAVACQQCPSAFYHLFFQQLLASFPLFHFYFILNLTCFWRRRSSFKLFSFQRFTFFGSSSGFTPSAAQFFSFLVFQFQPFRLLTFSLFSSLASQFFGSLASHFSTSWSYMPELFGPLAGSLFHYYFFIFSSKVFHLFHSSLQLFSSRLCHSPFSFLGLYFVRCDFVYVLFFFFDLPTFFALQLYRVGSLPRWVFRSVAFQALAGLAFFTFFGVFFFLASVAVLTFLASWAPLTSLAFWLSRFFFFLLLFRLFGVSSFLALRLFHSLALRLSLCGSLDNFLVLNGPGLSSFLIFTF